jgi:hypothetical protein
VWKRNHRSNFASDAAIAVNDSKNETNLQLFLNVTPFAASPKINQGNVILQNVVGTNPVKLVTAKTIVP